jgi:D-tagatose-1,6-bisphosphate aldolase subunit GatZ/KbaZ
MDTPFLKKMADDWHQHKPRGIMSACTASGLCIEAALGASKKRGIPAIPALIEATSNQVNQFGGYTGMRPADYYRFVAGIAGKAGVSMDDIILGGDHLGPQPFQGEAEKEAMKKAEDLVFEYAAAGFTKIHIDTSMRLADDDPAVKLSDSVIAGRAARLARAAVAGFRKAQSLSSGARFPVFVIGSEVPVPGGSREASSGISVTSPADLAVTLSTFKEAFLAEGLGEVWDNVIGVVVQPGVEFGDTELHIYDREKAVELSNSLRNYDHIIFEGHSTDYQTPESLRNMVHDGIGILKVGPGLTFYQREALFALAAIEAELLGGTGRELSNFPGVLENVMRENPSHWEKYYHGTPGEQRLKRKYSYSDRSRYYFPAAEVTRSFTRLMTNLSETAIPITLLSQYMPLQAGKVRRGEIGADPHALVISRITDLIEEYYYAVQP